MLEVLDALETANPLYLFCKLKVECRKLCWIATDAENTGLENRSTVLAISVPVLCKLLFFASLR